MANFKCIVPRLGEKDEHKFKMFTEPSMQKIGAQLLQVFDKDKEKPENIFKKYNAGIEAIGQNGGLNDDDIICFIHSDVGIVDNLFREKVELVFSEKPEVAILGIAGAIELTDRGGFWMNTPDKMRGHLIQGKEGGGQGDGFHLVKGAIGYFDDLVCVDGCIMITKGRFIKKGLCFDDKTFTSGNDFYDIDLCIRAQEMEYKIAVADILIFHASSGLGVFNDPWKNNKEKFIKKWQDKGYTLPFTPDQFKKKEILSEIVEIEI
jgi:hypothetical protein